jgi:POT family proton-dependent oligopeptide transporter
MLVGLIQFFVNHHKIVEVAASESQPKNDKGQVQHPPLSRKDLERMGVIGILFQFSAIFWALFQQAGSSLNIFAKEYTQETIGGFVVPASWYQVINPLFIIALGPVFAWLWTRLGERFTSPSKFASGLFLLGVGFLLMVPASWIAQATPGQIVRVSPLWLTGLYFLHTIAELCFSPVGMSLTSRLAPARFAGLMMGVWFASIGTGSFISGIATGLMDKLTLAHFFGIFGWIAVGAAVLLFLLKGFVLRLMGDGKTSRQ